MQKTATTVVKLSFYTACISPLLCVCSYISANPMPQADGNMHVYSLPVGEGDCQVIQCPSGDVAIVDMGTISPQGDGYWFTNDIRSFLGGQLSKVVTIVITHPHNSHCRYRTQALDHLIAMESVNILNCDLVLPTNKRSFLHYVALQTMNHC